MNDQTSRTCPYCAEIIMAEAKVCPRCRQWLSLRSLRHPLTQFFGIMVPLLVLMVFMINSFFSLLDRLQNPRPYYSEFPGSLKILQSRLNWAPTRDGLRIYLAGVLTNQSPVAWKNVEFDCRFFDPKGVLVDASTGYCHFTVNAHDDSAFRVSIVPTMPTNHYATYQILVSTAQNRSSLF